MPTALFGDVTDEDGDIVRTQSLLLSPMKLLTPK